MLLYFDENYDNDIYSFQELEIYVTDFVEIFLRMMYSFYHQSFFLDYIHLHARNFNATID